MYLTDKLEDSKQITSRMGGFSARVLHHSPEDGTPDNYQENQTKGKGDEIFVSVSVHYLICLSLTLYLLEALIMQGKPQSSRSSMARTS